MSYIRYKEKAGIKYYYQVKSVREGDKVIQKHIKYWGTLKPTDKQTKEVDELFKKNRKSEIKKKAKPKKKKLQYPISQIDKKYDKYISNHYFDEMGVTVRDIKGHGLNIEGVDSGLAVALFELNRNGFKSMQSMSGLKEDYQGKGKERYSDNGYIAFLKQENNFSELRVIKSIAEESKLPYSEGAIFGIPSVEVRTGITNAGVSTNQVRIEAGKQAMDKMGIPEEERIVSEPSIFFPEKDPNDKSPKDRTIFLDWIHQRDKLEEKITENYGGNISDDEIKKRWKIFTDKLVEFRRNNQLNKEQILEELKEKKLYSKETQPEVDKEYKRTIYYDSISENEDEIAIKSDKWWMHRVFNDMKTLGMDTRLDEKNQTISFKKFKELGITNKKKLPFKVTEKRQKMEDNTGKQIKNYFDKYRGNKYYSQIKIQTPQIRNMFDTLKSSNEYDKRKVSEGNYTSRGQIGEYLIRYDDRKFRVYQPKNSEYYEIEEIDY